jgi:hypothetical protein
VDPNADRPTFARLFPQPAISAVWLVLLLTAPLLTARWALHPSYDRAEWAVGAAVVAVLGTVALGCSLNGGLRLPRLGVLAGTGTVALLLEYVLTYAVAAPNDPTADNAMAVGVAMLSGPLLVVLGSLLGLGVGLRAVCDRLVGVARRPPPRPDVLRAARRWFRV